MTFGRARLAEKLTFKSEHDAKAKPSALPGSTPVLICRELIDLPVCRSEVFKLYIVLLNYIHSSK